MFLSFVWNLFLYGHRNRMQFNKVLVVGLGQLGLPVAKYVKERGFDTYGYDISAKAMERAEKIAGIKKADDATSSSSELNELIIEKINPLNSFLNPL